MRSRKNGKTVVVLRTAALVNVQRGDICPENIMRFANPQGTRSKLSYMPPSTKKKKKKLSFMPVSWGLAVLEDSGGPAINLRFSSSHALQDGKLCPLSDAESLVYLLYLGFVLY